MLKSKNKKNSITFIHANGFPPDSYKSILNFFEDDYHINKFLLRPLWKEKTDYKKIKSWSVFCNDFENYLNIENITKCIGIGHSIGGNIVLHTAIKEPDYFSKIILLDPTLFPPKIIFIWKFLNLFNLQEKILDLSKSAKNKKMKYKNYEEIFNNYRSKKIFKLIKDKDLKRYINSITRVNSDNSIDINYSNNWERTIYNKGLIKDNYIWKNIENLKLPCLIIAAENSTAFPYSSIKKIKKKNQSIQIEILKGVTHLFPFEKPEKVNDIINDFI